MPAALPGRIHAKTRRRIRVEAPPQSLMTSGLRSSLSPPARQGAGRGAAG